LSTCPFGVGDDHRLEDGLHHGIGKLLVHLLAAIFGVAQVAKPHRHAIELGGNRAQVIPGSPLDALLQFALTDAASGGRGAADRPDDGDEKADGDQNAAQRADGGDGGGPPGERGARLHRRAGGEWPGDRARLPGEARGNRAGRRQAAGRAAARNRK
jgi:hypothetical protein